jgi:hypothetical protein
VAYEGELKGVKVEGGRLKVRGLGKLVVKQEKHA